MEVNTSKPVTVFSNLPVWITNATAPNSSVSPNELSQGSDATEQAFRVVAMVTLLLAMVCLGCTMELGKIKAHILKPKGVVIAAVAQYGVMPLSAFSLAKLLQLEPAEAITVLVCGCCPGGCLSNILTLGVKGDVNLSIMMTTFSTMLALVLMPSLLYLYSLGFSDMGITVPYVGIITTLAMIIPPCAVGICVGHYAPKHAKLISKVGISMVTVSMTVLAVLINIKAVQTIRSVASTKLVVTAALMPLLGYILGYVLACLFKLNHSSRRTVAMETGCQNLQLCMTILMMSFPAEFIGLMYLFPMVYIAFQLSEGLVLILLFRCYERLKSPQESVV